MRRAQREQELGAWFKTLSDQRYGVIIADIEANADADVPSIAAKHCALFLWCSALTLPKALEAMTAWGFVYKSSQCRVKDHVEPFTTFWSTRLHHEILLIGTRGKIPAPAPGTQLSSVHVGPRETAIESIKGLYPSIPKIDLTKSKSRICRQTSAAL
jgi:N6-adenosine-specific RNA methylase IME4